MKIKLGQVVIKKNRLKTKIPYRVIGFDNDLVELISIRTGVKVCYPANELIVVEEKRKTDVIKRIK